MADTLRRWLERRFREVPTLYRAIRGFHRAAVSIPREILRRFSWANSRFGAPKGVFSALELLDQGNIKGRVRYRAQNTPPTTPNSMIARCGYGQDRQQPWPAFWAEMGEMRLVGRSRVPINREKLACREAIYGWFREDVDCNYFVLPPPTILEGPWISLDSGHYYHWFHEALPRLWALSELPPETGILIADYAPPYVWDTLRWLGVEKRVRLAHERHFIVENLYFLSPTVYQGCPNPLGLQFLRERFLPHADRAIPTPRRIYLTRAGKARQPLQEEEVMALFRQRGWVVVDPETMSLAQQIALFADAEAVCGPHGAALTNLVWCSPGCRVLELFSEGFLNGCYEGIALCLELPYRWLEFPADVEFRTKIDVSRVDAVLKEMGL